MDVPTGDVAVDFVDDVSVRLEDELLLPCNLGSGIVVKGVVLLVFVISSFREPGASSSSNAAACIAR